MSCAAIEQLKDLLGDKLCTPEQVKAPEGIPTGVNELDGYLLWRGLPKGALSLLSGALGTGATTLFIESASRVIAAGKWVAWINNDIPLSPLPLAQKGVDLGRFVSVQPDACVNSTRGASPREIEKARCAHLFFILQELLSSSIFELVGCDLGTLQFAEHQLRKLQTQARDANVALVFIAQNPHVARLASARRRALFYSGSAASVFSLILQFEKKRLTVERALHRQTPHHLARSFSYARFTNFATQSLAHRDVRKIERTLGRKPHPLPQAR
jgi:recombination protein RecA